MMKQISRPAAARRTAQNCGMLSVLLTLLLSVSQISVAEELQRVAYRNPGLVVDLGVGLWAWPLPMDYDRDGDYDLVVSCPDKPYNGTYFFENTEGDVALPVFRPGVRIGPGFRNIQISYLDDAIHVMTPATRYRDFRSSQFEQAEKLPLPANLHTQGRKIRANQWKSVDFDGDGDQDIVVGVGDWADYGWDDAYNSAGEWTNGPLRGYVYVVRNTGSETAPAYAEPRRLQVAGHDLEVFGWPSPNFADMDGDGDLDLICGEFLDRFTYFENLGSRSEPRYAAGRFLHTADGMLRMDLQMITPVLLDWDKDGDPDLICGDEDGRVAFIENTGRIVNRLPEFRAPRYFQQQATDLKFGALATPYSVDWDGDGDEDILCGNTAGYVGFFENLGGGPLPRWDRVKRLNADGRTLRIQAGPNGSIQGPCEAKWGYTTLSVADWNHDTLPDLIVNSIWGEVLWYENAGTREQPRLKAGRPIEVAWAGAPPKPEWTWWEPRGRQLATQWRTTPVAIDWTGDGLLDLVMLDHEGYLALFEREQHGDELRLLPGRRIFVDEQGRLLQLNPKRAGGSGRRKLAICDWDGDGRLDVLANSQNADLLRNLGMREGKVVLQNTGPIDSRKLAGHTSSPAVADWNADGIPDLLVGAEDGYLYLRLNSRGSEERAE